MPEGRSLMQINSEQVRRSSKEITKQVNAKIHRLHTYTCWQTQKEDVLRNQTFNNSIPLVCLHLNDISGLIQIPPASGNRIALIKAPSLEMVILGFRQLTRKVPSIFMIVRGCVRQ
jgi:hypothetical protein